MRLRGLALTQGAASATNAGLWADMPAWRLQGCTAGSPDKLLQLSASCAPCPLQLRHQHAPPLRPPGRPRAGALPAAASVQAGWDVHSGLLVCSAARWEVYCELDGLAARTHAGRPACRGKQVAGAGTAGKRAGPYVLINKIWLTPVKHRCGIMVLLLDLTSPNTDE
jgi:hypothetical protein